MIGKWATFPFAPGKFHDATVEGGFRAGGDHHCLGDQNAGVLGKCLTLLLFACVDSKWERRFDAGDNLGHVVVNVGLGNSGICAVNVSDEIANGDCIETFSGVIEFCIIHIVDDCRDLVACDCADNDVCFHALGLARLAAHAASQAGAAAGGLMG